MESGLTAAPSRECSRRQFPSLSIFHVVSESVREGARTSDDWTLGQDANLSGGRSAGEKIGMVTGSGGSVCVQNNLVSTLHESMCCL